MLKPGRNHQSLVVTPRFELGTPTMSRWCSNQLSYATVKSGRVFYLRNLTNQPAKNLYFQGFRAISQLLNSFMTVGEIFNFSF